MFVRFDYTLLSTSILLVRTLSLSPPIPSSNLPSNLPSVQNKQFPSQSHNGALAQNAASLLTHAPNVGSSSLKLYHYHHNPTRKRSPSHLITCPSILINWTQVFSYCERNRSPQAFIVLCQLAYGPGPNQHFSQYVHQQCDDTQICVDTMHTTQAYCVPFENFAQKSFEKFVGVVTNPTASVVLGVAEAVLTGESRNEGMIGQALSLKAISANGQVVDASKGSEKCENCRSLTMADIPTGTTGLDVKAAVVGDRPGNLFVITQVSDTL
ncbi:hypothetical protein MMC26_003951 [Xylographa opegraphella]|nr:hypothetical protein [Xylographa opegraphella]